MRLIFVAATTLLLFTPALHAEDAVKAPTPVHSAESNKSSAHKLNKAELDTLLAKPEGLLVIDVRRPDEITKYGGLPVYLSIQVADVEKYLPFIPHERALVIISNHAGRAGPVADLLKAHNFKVAGIAGVLNYEEEGGALTKIVPPEPKEATAR